MNNDRGEMMSIILKTWKKHRDRKREEERQKAMDEENWQPSISDIEHVKRTVWRIQPGDEYYDEFFEMYDVFGCREDDEFMGLYIDKDKAECVATNPENPYRAALDLAWSRVDPDVFRSPQQKANPPEFDDVVM